MKNVIVRIAPVSNVPVIFYADSKANGQIRGYLEGQERMLGLDFYQMSSPMDEEQARKVAMEFAKQQNIDPHDISVRQRLPKTVGPKRKLNDANLVLVPSEKPKQEAAPSSLAEFAQALQDEHNTSRRKDDSKENAVVDKALEPLKELADQYGKKASPKNPEGAVVQTKQKRKYNRKTKEQSAKSRVAYERYLKEIGQAVAKSPTIMEPVATNAPKEVVDEAVMNLALALAKILKGTGAL